MELWKLMQVEEMKNIKLNYDDSDQAKIKGVI